MDPLSFGKRCHCPVGHPGSERGDLGTLGHRRCGRSCTSDTPEDPWLRRAGCVVQGLIAKGQDQAVHWPCPCWTTVCTWGGGLGTPPAAQEPQNTPGQTLSRAPPLLLPLLSSRLCSSLSPRGCVLGPRPSTGPAPQRTLHHMGVLRAQDEPHPLPDSRSFQPCALWVARVSSLFASG